MLELIKELSSLSGISGRENAVRDYIISKLPSKAEYSVDAMGNLIVFVKGRNTPKNKVMLAAHMDEVGMIVTYITDNGYIKFTNVGGVDTSVLLGRKVKVGDSELLGAIGVTPIHLRRGDSEQKLPKTDSLYVDVGATSKEELLGVVNLGDKIVFDSEPIEFGNCLKGKALDDRLGCAVLLDMINSELENDTYFAFTVQEEVGLRGAGCAAYAVKPDYAIVVETTTAADISGVSGEKEVCHLGKGAVVPFMDRSTVYSPELFARANALAAEKGFKLQTKSLVAGGNDAGAIHKSGCGVKTVTVSFATRYLHSPCCVINKNDINDIQLAVKALAEDFAND